MDELCKCFLKKNEGGFLDSLTVTVWLAAVVKLLNFRLITKFI
jgi:hypothetical protein